MPPSPAVRCTRPGPWAGADYRTRNFFSQSQIPHLCALMTDVVWLSTMEK